MFERGGISYDMQSALMMSSAKALRVAPITSSDAREIVRKLHYSGKVCQNSIIHLGVFAGDSLLGAMQFGTPIDKRRTIPLVQGTRWRGMLELNRMAFSDVLPKNSESRALSVALRMIRKQYPFIEWILSFADACQCGDGTIYRASGFLLVQIKKNSTLLRMPDGRIEAGKTLDDRPGRGVSYWKRQGAKPLEGFQIKYIRFLNPAARSRLTVPVLPYSALDEAGARMYRGLRAKHSGDAPA